MMFQLAPASTKVREDYVKKILHGLIDRVKHGQMFKGHLYELKPAAKEILFPKWRTKNPDKSVLVNLLCYEPKELVKLNDDIWKKFGKLGKNKPTKKTLEIIFHYDGVFNAHKDVSYWLAKLIQRNTCTYCNRQYVFTVERPVIKSNKDYIAKPVFDHWFAKSDYPLLSLSIHNLIPSCTVCNSSVKGTTKMSINNHIHPYIPEPNEADFTFRATKTISTQPEWELKIDRKAGSRIDNTIKDFALDEIYALHAPLEAKDIMDFHDAYPDDYLKTLFSILNEDNKWHLTQAEVYRILFGTELDSDKFLDRPFSKLKHDLLKQIGVID